MSFALVGHRGAMAEVTENTTASFALAEALGVDEVETDVRVSADGQLIMLHDATLDRVAADEVDHGLGPVAELSWERIAAVTLRGGHRVPTLTETYTATRGTIQLEIKAPHAIDGLIDFFAAEPDWASRTMITSFSVPLLAEVTHRLPDIPRGIIVFGWQTALDHPGGPHGLMADTGSSRIHTGFARLDRAAVDDFHAADWPVHAWPLRSPDDLVRARDLGADGMTTDDPRAAARWLHP